MAIKYKEFSCSWCGNRQTIGYYGEKIESWERITECSNCHNRRVFFDVERV